MDQSIPAAPSAPPGYCEAFARLSVPGVGHLQILCCSGAGHLPTPRPFPSFWHARSFLSEYNYTEDFTGKENRLGQRPCKGMFLILCMHFFIAYQARITWRNLELSKWINVFGHGIKCLLILFEKHPFIFIKLFITYNSGRSWNWLMHNNFKVRIVRLFVSNKTFILVTCTSGV